jgi:pyruvate dehydrogenase E1 component
MNENYPHPDMPKGSQAGILKGLYKFQDAGKDAQVQLLGSGTILREAIAAAKLLQEDFKIKANVWSATSYGELRREGLDSDRWNMLHPDQPPRTSYVHDCLSPTKGPIIAASDYVRAVPEMIRSWVPRRFVVLGTDGYGRSDARRELRRFFEVDRYYIAVAALKALADDGKVSVAQVKEAIALYQIDPEKPNPVTV